MKKLMLLVALVAGGFVVTSSQVAKADHQSGCRSGWGDGYYSSGYSYGGYNPSYSYGYDSYYYPSYSFGYARPGISVSIGSGYRGYGYGGYGGSGGYRGRHGQQHHHH